MALQSTMNNEPVVTKAQDSERESMNWDLLEDAITYVVLGVAILATLGDVVYHLVAGQ